jgi:hypothetical protein
LPNGLDEPDDPPERPLRPLRPDELPPPRLLNPLRPEELPPPRLLNPLRPEDDPPPIRPLKPLRPEDEPPPRPLRPLRPEDPLPRPLKPLRPLLLLLLESLLSELSADPVVDDESAEAAGYSDPVALGVVVLELAPPSCFSTNSVPRFCVLAEPGYARC